MIKDTQAYIILWSADDHLNSYKAIKSRFTLWLHKELQKAIYLLVKDTLLRLGVFFFHFIPLQCFTYYVLKKNSIWSREQSFSLYIVFTFSALLKFKIFTSSISEIYVLSVYYQQQSCDRQAHEDRDFYRERCACM